MRIFFEAGVFVEIAVLKYLAAIEHVVAPQEKVIARHELGGDPSAIYHSDLIMLHPFKQSYLRNQTIKQGYCTTVVRTFREMLLKV
ncbi:unnamed protein product [Cylicocyclus nassatus]|nr:unnamed protein product [Cylicocyclus nassatus]